jgi:hypothetical protein
MAIDIDKELDKLNAVWRKRKQEGLQGWHGYGVNSDESRLVLFVEPGFDEEEIIKAAKLNTEVQSITDTLSSVHFRQMDTGDSPRPSTPLRPGARVFGVGPSGVSCNGTIAAFLKLHNDGKNGSYWLLSNQHVLADEDGLPYNVEVRGAGQTLLSREVRVPEFTGKPRAVDAAVARIGHEDIEDIEISYDRIRINSPKPLPGARVTRGLKVQKFGNATGVTSGELISRRATVEVANCKDEGTTVYADQLVFGSKSDTFLAHGDSGALVISNEDPVNDQPVDKHPVALMFAIAEDVPQLPDDLKDFMPPFGLASPIATVLEKLPHDQGQHWEILLGNPHDEDEREREKKPYKEAHDAPGITSPEYLQQLPQKK